MIFVKLSFNDIDGLLWQLTNRLWDNKIDFQTYLAEWDELLAFACWSEIEFLQELDNRWSTMDRKGHTVFLC